jgi:hypothetical protein
LVSAGGPKLALDFIEELNRAGQTILESPTRWPVGKNDTRRFLLWRFPFAIIYSEQESVATIWAVAARQQTTGILGSEAVAFPARPQREGNRSLPARSGVLFFFLV